MRDPWKAALELGIQKRDLDLAFTFIRDFSAVCNRAKVDPRAATIALAFTLACDRIASAPKISAEEFARLESIGLHMATESEDDVKRRR